MKVTIPMASYQSKSFLKQSMTSVAIQSYTNWELIIVDDASTDGSLNIARQIAKELGIMDKTKFLVNSKNHGYGYTLRRAIAEGDGEIIAIVDSDDAINKSRALKTIVSMHKAHPEAVMVYTDHWECNAKLKKEKKFLTRQMKPGETMLNGDVKIRHWKTFKRSFYDMTDGVSDVLRQTVDKDLVFKLEEVGPSIHIPECLYLYRKHNDNLTRSTRRKPKEYRKWIKKMRNQIYTDAKERRSK